MFSNTLLVNDVAASEKSNKEIQKKQSSLSIGIKKARAPQKFQVQRTEHENLLDQIDVYTLSPYATRIALHRMVPKSVIERAARGEITLPSDWNDIIKTASERHCLDPALIAAVIKVESGFRQKVVSSKGAQGLMQVMPKTGLELGITNLFDPSENVNAGSRYLRQQLDRFGSLELALAAYNAGPGAVMKYGGIPPYKETQSFVKKVLSAL